MVKKTYCFPHVTSLVCTLFKLFFSLCLPSDLRDRVPCQSTPAPPVLGDVAYNVSSPPSTTSHWSCYLGVTASPQVTVCVRSAVVCWWAASEPTSSSGVSPTPPVALASTETADPYFGPRLALSTVVTVQQRRPWRSRTPPFPADPLYETSLRLTTFARLSTQFLSAPRNRTSYPEY